MFLFIKKIFVITKFLPLSPSLDLMCSYLAGEQFPAIAFHQQVLALSPALIKREDFSSKKHFILFSLITLGETVEARKLAELHARAIEFPFSILAKTRSDPAKL